MLSRLPVERLVTTGQAARLLGVGTPMARAYAEAGLVRAVNTPHGWLLDVEDVRRLAAERGDRKLAKGTVTAIAAGQSA